MELADATYTELVTKTLQDFHKSIIAAGELRFYTYGLKLLKKLIRRFIWNKLQPEAYVEADTAARM